MHGPKPCMWTPPLDTLDRRGRERDAAACRSACNGLSSCEADDDGTISCFIAEGKVWVDTDCKIRCPQVCSRESSPSSARTPPGTPSVRAASQRRSYLSPCVDQLSSANSIRLQATASSAKMSAAFPPIDSKVRHRLCGGMLGIPRALSMNTGGPAAAGMLACGLSPLLCSCYYERRHGTESWRFHVSPEVASSAWPTVSAQL